MLVARYFSANPRAVIIEVNNFMFWKIKFILTRTCWGGIHCVQNNQTAGFNYAH